MISTNTVVLTGRNADARKRHRATDNALSGCQVKLGALHLLAAHPKINPLPLGQVVEVLERLDWDCYAACLELTKEQS